MIQLSSEDSSAFVDLLSSLPEFRTETERWRLIDDVLTGAPREDTIRSLLDLGGRPRSAAVSLLSSLTRFGQVEPGKETIGILANKLLDGYVFDPEQVTFLRELFTRYSLDKAVASSIPIKDWKGQDGPTNCQNCLKHFALPQQLPTLVIPTTMQNQNTGLNLIIC